jgi:hypothetical protein
MAGGGLGGLDDELLAEVAAALIRFERLVEVELSEFE